MDDRLASTVVAGESVLVVIDMQERLAAAMPDGDEAAAVAALLIRSAHALEMPVIVTRQYPHGLGETVPAVTEALGEHEPVDKITFDCTAEPAFVSRLERSGRKTVVIAGMETHICVAQTALSLARMGRSVHVVADGVCSRRHRDRDVALARMRAAGIVVSTAESVIYEALSRADTPVFREVLRLIKEHEAR